MSDRIPVLTSLRALANKAQRRPDHRFRNLYRLLDEDGLREAWTHLRKDAATGVDRVSAQDYERELDANLRRLAAQLKSKRYRARLVRRRYIPKGEGTKLRPLGIPATEDKLVQMAVKRLLEAIYEQDFLRCSYGYRPDRSALDAVDKLTLKLQFGKYHYVVEADIRGFFEHLDHEWLLRMLAQRVDDRALLWLIKKWLKAGILETEGEIVHPQAGTPQGGVISPILANVYLHYALDLWFEKVVKPHCRGEACLIRYADDFVCAFEHQGDAERFYAALRPRLAKFGLALSEEKTRVLPFEAQAARGASRFDFLGFEFRWGRDRQGQPRVQRRTARSRLRRSVTTLKAWLRENRHQRIPVLLDQLNAKLRGYYRYYGVSGNGASLKLFFWRVLKQLYQQLNQRSHRKSYTWAGLEELLTLYRIERPRIVARARTRLAGRAV